MAKGKRATALFEVMSKARLAGGKNAPTPGGGIPTPKWWFNSKNRGGVRVIPPEEPALPPEPPAHEELETPESDHYVEEPALAAESNPANDADSSVRPQPVALSVDPDKQQISLRLSYTSALIGGFGLFIALGLAVLIGKGLSRGPSMAIGSQSTETLLKNPPTPGVMNITRRSEPSGSNDVVEGNSHPRTAPSTGTRAPQPSSSEPRPPATFYTEDPHRQNGLNYAIIQSYPDKETADKAAEFLTQHGIGCTVERNLPNWRLPWADGCVVVGIRGYAKVSNNPSLEAYKRSIMEVSTKFASGKGRFASFAPTMYLWKKSN